MLLRDVHPQDVSIRFHSKLSKSLLSRISIVEVECSAFQKNSGSLYNFSTGSSLSQSIGTYNGFSKYG